MADHVGQQLGSYRLIELLGWGGFAEVYLGKHVYLGTNAAVKVLTTKLTDDQIALFRKEASTIMGLRHRNIVKVLDFGMEGNLPFIVMDYTPNGSLRKVYPRGTRLSLLTIVNYVQQTAAALQYSHDANLVHRDIKPDNLLLGTDNEIWLSDFGIATITNSVYQSQQDMLGTITYMAPEQIRGKPRRASDQYALGIVVYEWLSGTVPFQGTFTEIASQHTNTLPPPLHEKIPEIPSAIEEVVMRALAKRPEERFANVRDFATALEKACELPDEHYYPENVSRAIRECYYQSADIMSRLGAPRNVSQDSVKKKSKRGTEGYKRPFTDGSIYWCERGGAQPVSRGFAELHVKEHAVEGPLGFPLTNELRAAPSPSPYETTGFYQRFEGKWDYPEDIDTNPIRCGASMYWSKHGAFITWGGIGMCYERLCGTASYLGFPTSPELAADPSHRGTTGKYQCFEGGFIYWRADTGEMHHIGKEIGVLYHSDNGVKGRLGFPISDEMPADTSPQETTGVLQRFEGGPADLQPVEGGWDDSEGVSVYSSKHGIYPVWGGIAVCYKHLGNTRSTLGFPISLETIAGKSPQGTTGWYQRFEGGIIFWCENYGGVPVVGSILAPYDEFGGTEGRFGFPKSPEKPTEQALHMLLQEFEGGVIVFPVGSAEKSFDVDGPTQ